MTRPRSLGFAVLFLGLVALACGGPKPAPPEAEQAAPLEGAAAREPRTVALKDVRGVSYAVVGEPVEEGTWAPAEAMADEAGRRMLSAPIAGVVERLAVAPGREVAKGAVLVTLRSPELAALAATWRSSRARQVQAQAARAREQRLAQAGAGAAADLEAAEAELAVAQAAVESAELALRGYGVDPARAAATLWVRAPGRGRVSRYEVLEGQGVSAGAALGVFESGAGPLVRVELLPPAPPTWIPGAATRVRRSDGKSWSARVEGLPASLSADTRRLGFRLRLEGGDLPFPGTPLEVRVPLPAGLTVPQDAVQQVEGVVGVFVAEGETATFHPIRRGPELGGDVIVLAGVEPGQRIATNGAYLLKALLLKASGEGEAHDH